MEPCSGPIEKADCVFGKACCFNTSCTLIDGASYNRFGEIILHVNHRILSFFRYFKVTAAFKMTYNST